jgi:hypothetical protein
MTHHAEWALLSPNTASELLNHADGGSFSWGKFWPTLASHYAIPAGLPIDSSSTLSTSSSISTFSLPASPPPLGYGPPGTITATFTFASWSTLPAVRQAWSELTSTYNLTGSPFDPDTFNLLDAEILGSWGRVLNMNKNRKLGWHGFVDTNESMLNVIGEMAGLGLVPPMPVE